jgi:ribosome recycling factor
MDIDSILSDVKQAMAKAIQHLEAEHVKIRAGKASIDMLDGIMVDYYGSPTAINQVANVQLVDARTISITPWEKPMLAQIDRSIMGANIGITPQNDGIQVRLFMPPVTEERRKELSKRAYAEGEQAKIVIRNIRRDAIEQIKKLQKDGLSEDEAKDAEARVQGHTDKNAAQIEQLCTVKEKELMTV